MLINNETGEALPSKKPENLLIEDNFHTGRLLDWEIGIEKKIPLAASVATQDTLNFVEFHSMGATYAVYLKAVNNKTGQQREGWVSCGSFMFPYKAIRLDDQTSLVMPEREPRRFASEVKVYTESGCRDSATIEVNKPFELEGWKIYQLSYDESKGRWSDISVFELVRDPWLPVVYTGIWMMIAGAVCLFALSQKRKGGQHMSWDQFVIFAIVALFMLGNRCGCRLERKAAMDGLYGYISGIGCLFCLHSRDVDLSGTASDAYDG